MKRLVASILVFTLLISNICYAAMPALTKEETVYVNLGYYGNVEQMNIYSRVTTNGEAEITDYTKYDNISNLTNRTVYTQDDEKITWDVSGENSFAYTGRVGEEYYDKIPWNFDISYQLNGVEVVPEKLLGASGLIKITIDIHANELANEYYQNNYMLEVTGTFNMSDYLSVHSEEAMIINTGNEKTLLFVVLPGQSTSMTLELGSEDFSMTGITMAMVPITGELLNQISDIAEEKQNIEDALEAMNVSADIVLNSLGGMTAGLNGVSEGVTQIKNGTTQVHGISNLRDEDIAKLKNLLNELKPMIENMSGDLNNLQDTYHDVMDMWGKVNEELTSLSVELKQLNDNLAECEDMIDRLPGNVKDIKSTITDLAKLAGNLSDILSDFNSMQSLPTSSVKELISDVSADLAEIAEIAGEILQDPDSSDAARLFAEEVLEEIAEINKTIKNSSTAVSKITSSVSNISKDANSTSKTLKDLKTDLYEIEDMFDKKDAQILVDTVGDFNQLAKRLDTILDIALEYNDKFLNDSGDVTKAIENSKQVVNELDQLDTICISMLENVETMLAALSGNIYQGTQKTMDALTGVNQQLMSLTSQSSNIKASKDTIKNILDDKKEDIETKTTVFNIDKEAEVVSFGSENNEKVSEVEFLVKTPDIKKTKENTSADLEKSDTENVSFWDRVVGIFKSIFGWIGNLFQ
ncbi:MAG: hypothetical protein IJ215_04625 [Clostridia bacterium]|nr:hypothetical protein [Clostridia bacterium]